MADVELGKCEVCGKENVQLSREYFEYGIECECCSRNHFVIVRHCKDCTPKEPMEIRPVLKAKDYRRWIQWKSK